MLVTSAHGVSNTGFPLHLFPMASWRKAGRSLDQRLGFCLLGLGATVRANSQLLRQARRVCHVGVPQNQYCPSNIRNKNVKKHATWGVGSK